MLYPSLNVSFFISFFLASTTLVDNCYELTTLDISCTNYDLFLFDFFFSVFSYIRQEDVGSSRNL
jgi:hypothetical protein